MKIFEQDCAHILEGGEESEREELAGILLNSESNNIWSRSFFLLVFISS